MQRCAVLCLWECDPWRGEHYKTIINEKSPQITVPKHCCCSPSIHNHWRNGALHSVQTQYSTNTWSFNLDLTPNSTYRGWILAVSSSGEESRIWNLFYCLKCFLFCWRENWISKFMLALFSLISRARSTLICHS